MVVDQKRWLKEDCIFIFKESPLSFESQGAFPFQSNIFIILKQSQVHQSCSLSTLDCKHSAGYEEGWPCQSLHRFHQAEQRKHARHLLFPCHTWTFWLTTLQVMRCSPLWMVSLATTRSNSPKKIRRRRRSQHLGGRTAT